jgi:hypothetical protein
MATPRRSEVGAWRTIAWPTSGQWLRRTIEETNMFNGLAAQRLVALFFAAAALFNFPLLALWDHDARVWGLPLFPLALFVIWGVLIAVLAWVVEHHSNVSPLD